MNSEIEISDFDVVSWEVNELIDFDESSSVPDILGRYWFKNLHLNKEIDTSFEGSIIYH